MLSKSQVKYIQSLCHKKFRDEQGAFIAEGPKLAQELLLQNRLPVRGVYALDHWLNENPALLEHLAPEQITPVTEDELGKISALTTPNQVLIMAGIPQAAPPPATISNWVLALDGLQDPGNLGTILRTADWFGISQVICSKDCADVFNPKVVQATMGSIARIIPVYTDLANWLASLTNTSIVAAVLEGMPLPKAPQRSSGVLLIGNESKGIRPPLTDYCNLRITIPRLGHAESLNAAVATGILLAHLRL